MENALKSLTENIILHTRELNRSLLFELIFLTTVTALVTDNEIAKKFSLYTIQISIIIKILKVTFSAILPIQITQRPDTAKHTGFFVNLKSETPSINGMPSGHCMMAVAMSLIIIDLFCLNDFSKHKKELFAIYTIAGSIILSRSSFLYPEFGLGVHTNLQIVVGCVLGYIVGKVYTNSFFY